jgi:acetate kinase
MHLFYMVTNMQNQSVLVINCGSSSVKFSLINPISGKTQLTALAERLLSDEASLTINKNEQPLPEPFDHKTAINALVHYLQEQQLINDINVVGHRIVHGGERYSEPTLITEEVLSNINALANLAPLHNPANVIGIEAAQLSFQGLPQVAVFDTAFHQTMPEKAYLYGIPYPLYQEHKIRRYGFHGTSHYYIAQQAALKMKKPLAECNFISAHLGNGCSITAIKKGESVDTSLGFTPLEGVMMGTRSGDLDAGIIFYLVQQLGYSLTQVNNLLNKKSGLLGLSQLSNDCRTLEQALQGKNLQQKGQAQLALDIFCYRIAKQIAAYSVVFNQLDGLIFTGGIGENSMFIRENIIKQLSLLNFDVDADKNAAMRFGQSGEIQKAGSRLCWVIPTNEEWVIAEQSHQLAKQLSQQSAPTLITTPAGLNNVE